MADFSPMTNEQRQRWKESGLFPVERWNTGPGSTPLVPGEGIDAAIDAAMKEQT